MKTPSPNPAYNHLKRWMIVTYGIMVVAALSSSFDGSIFGILLVLALLSLIKTFNLWLMQRTFNKPQDERREHTFSSHLYTKSTSGTVYGNDSFAKMKTLFLKNPRAKLAVIVWIVLVASITFAWLLVSNSDYTTDFNHYYNRAEDHYASENYDSAYYYYHKALTVDPYDPQALFGYANVLYMKGYPDSSIYYYDQAIIMDPYSYDPVYNKGWVYYQQKQYDLSIAELMNLLEVDPQYYSAMQLMGDNYYAQNNFGEALQWYERAYQAGIRNFDLCYVMAYIHDSKNNHEVAIPLYQEALLYNDTAPAIYKRLGELLPGKEGDVYRQRLSQLN